MRNIIMALGIVCLIIFTITFICCRYQDYYHDPLRDIEVGEMHDYEFDDSEINSFFGMKLNSISRIFSWINFNIEYQRDIVDYWQLPEETYQKKTGDCEDFCILFMYLLKKKLDIESKLILLSNKKESHTIIYIPSLDQYYDYQGNQITKKGIRQLNIIWYAPYAETIWMTYHYHNNVGKYY